MTGENKLMGLEGEFKESELPLLIRRAGMVAWDDGVVRILDRRRLPAEESYVDCHTVEAVANAIEDMVIQGAFSSAIAAGYGLALSDQKTLDGFQSDAARLIDTRPTGLALRRMINACMTAAEIKLRNNEDPVSTIVATVDRAAADLARQGWKTGARLARIIDDGATILTHCFPDRSYVYFLMECRKLGKQVSVVCGETRPYLQGTRLTALCAQQAGFDTTVISDGMGGYLMRSGEIDALVTAADRVCMDGTVCNKIGTYQYALAARDNNLPYYVLRQSGPDLESANESAIEVEMRDGDALLSFAGHRIAPDGVKGLYPSFDITPPELVHAIVTDRGIFDATDIYQYSDEQPFVTDAIL